MRLISNNASRDFWLFMGIALLLLGVGIGLRDPWPADEPRFVLAARQMVESGQWLFPMRGDEFYPDKPPMFMWALALSYLAVGSWRLSFLLPSLLAAMGTLWLVQDLGRRLWHRRIGLYAGYALLFALQFTMQAKRAQIDASVMLLITLSMYALLRHLLCGPRRDLLLLGCFAAGLGVITKGVGVIALLVAVPVLLGRALRWPGINPTPFVLLLSGALAFLFAIALWLVPMLVAVNQLGDPALRDYADNILLQQTARRYAESWHHHQPLWYFAGVIATMWLPAALALPWAVPAWWRRLKRRDPRYLLPLGWVLAVLVFFSIPSGKRDLYILPALPMFALALAPLLPGLLRRRGPRVAMLCFVLLLATIGLLGGGLALFGEPRYEVRLEAERGLDAASDGVWWLLSGIGASALALALWGRQKRALAAVLGSLAATWLWLCLAAYPLLDDTSSARQLMRTVARTIGPEAELGLVAWREQNLLQADRPAATFGFRRTPSQQMHAALAWQRARPQARWILTQEEAMGECVDAALAVPLTQSNRRDWWLFRAEAVRPSCR